ncbi:hypothetical protein Ancab_001637 [Ancistrocladus abbreviatus]
MSSHSECSSLKVKRGFGGVHVAGPEARDRFLFFWVENQWTESGGQVANLFVTERIWQSSGMSLRASGGLFCGRHIRVSAGDKVPGRGQDWLLCQKRGYVCFSGYRASVIFLCRLSKGGVTDSGVLCGRGESLSKAWAC